MPRSASKRRTCRNKKERPSGRFFYPHCRCGLVVALLLAASAASGQVTVSKTLLDPEVDAIVIDGRQCFDIGLETAPTREVSVEARMEGEYEADILVRTERMGNTLFIGTGLAPGFQFPNDKLGAHKVVSIRLRVVLPEHQKVSVHAGQCQVRTSGVYRELTVRVNDGGCLLEHQAEHTDVRTLSAPITARVEDGIIEASSRYGEVHLDPVPAGTPRLLLRTTRGDIRVVHNP